MFIIADALTVLARFPKRRFRLVIADPPYNIGKQFGDRRDSMPLDEWTAWAMDWITQCRDRLTEDGLVYVYGYPEYLCRVAAQFAPNQQRWLQWHYDNRVAPQSKFWQRSHESILCLWHSSRSKPPAIQIDAVRIPYSEHSIRQEGKIERPARARFGNREYKRTNHPQGSLPRDTLIEPVVNGGRAMSEGWVWCDTCKDAYPWKEFNADHGDHKTTQHPTVKPMALTQRLVQSVYGDSDGKPSGTTFVPFAGSGSELHVLADLGIDFLGCEIDGTYGRLIERRLRKSRKYLL